MITQTHKLEKSRTHYIYKIEQKPSEFRSPWQRQRKEGSVIRVCQCPDCDREFRTKPYLIKMGYGKFCSPRCGGRSRTVDFTQPIEKHNVEDCYNVLAFAVRLYTNERPIEETDEYQDGYFGLVYACENYRGPTTFATFAIRKIRDAILKGRKRLGNHKRYGRFCFSGLLSPGTEHNSLNETILHELQQDVKDAMGALTEVQRTRLHDYYFIGLSAKEIAKKYGVNVDTVFYSIRLARTRLAELLQPWREVIDTPTCEDPDWCDGVDAALEVIPIESKRVKKKEAVLKQLAVTEDTFELIGKLDVRQLEVLALAVAGYTVRETASQLNRGMRYVNSRRTEICKILNLPRLAGINRIASHAGLANEVKRILEERRAA